MQELLEQSLLKMKQGLNLDQVVLDAPEELRAELKILLQTSLLLLQIPSIQAPKPTLRRKYALAPMKEKFWLSVFHISRFAAGSTALALLLAVFSIGGYKALSSMPGQALFPIKKTAESVRLKFVMNQASKASLQLEFAENRFKEAKEILNNPQSSKQQEIAALNELESQTKTAAESVQKAAYNEPLNLTSHPLASKLENLAKQQTELIKTNKSQDADVKLAAGSAAEASKTATSQAGEIKKYLSIAQNPQDQAGLVDLSADPNTVSISGVIQKVGLYSVTVEKTAFQITDKTEIKNLAGQKLSMDDLKTDLKIKITGKKDNSAIITQNILILTKDDGSGGQVEGLATSTPQSTTTPPTATSSLPAAKPLPTPTNTPSLNTQEKPRLGDFIIEDPNPVMPLK